MSGPKLMHITNDPKVIERINNRLNTIGKQNYFSIQIQSINTDIQNEISWVKNYVTETINKTVIQQDKTEYLHNSLLNIKNNYLATYYNILEKNISNSLSDAILKDAKKKQMSVQYQFLCDYLELEPQKNINNIKEDKLENIINDLTSKASDKAYRMYVEDTIGNIMKEYGYNSVASYNVGEDKKNTRIVFSNNDINICSSVSKDAVMIQVVGIGEDQPTKEEIHEQLEQQGALCSLYPQIKEKMEENNIHIINEDCAPISEDSVMNISISKMPSKRKKKSYNTGFGRNADTSRGFYEQYGRKVMHIDS